MAVPRRRRVRLVGMRVVRFGEIAEKLKKLRAAFQIYSKVELENPQHTGALNRLGRFFLAAGDLERSADYVEKILKLNSNDIEGLTLRGAVHFRKDDYTNAASVWGATLHHIIDGVIVEGVVP